MKNHTCNHKREQEVAFCRHGRAGGKFETKIWANGKTMVVPEGKLGDQAIERQRAVELFRAGWKIII